MSTNMYAEKKASYFDEVRFEVIDILPKNIDRCLEIGCGSGATLSHIKDRQIANWVGGVELTENVELKKRKNLDLIVIGNIENITLPIEDESIDVILCLDVLEHLIDPWVTVRNLKKYLKPGGILIASLPNVKNLKVLVPLIFRDEWSYSPSGILDKTHLRFFTLKTSIDMFEMAELKVVQIPIFFNKQGKAGLLNTLTAGIFRSFLQHQYLFVTRKQVSAPYV